MSAFTIELVSASFEYRIPAAALTSAFTTTPAASCGLGNDPVRSPPAVPEGAAPTTNACQLGTASVPALYSHWFVVVLKTASPGGLKPAASAFRCVVVSTGGSRPALLRKIPSVRRAAETRASAAPNLESVIEESPIRSVPRL